MANPKIELLLDLKDRISQGINRAKAAVSEASEEMKKKLGGLKTYWVDAFKEMRDQIPVFDKAVRFITNPIGAAITASVGLGKALHSTVSAAMDWQKGMAEINVTAGLSREELEKLSKTMLDIGSKNVAPLEEVPTAFNKIISAGLTANDALAALDPTLKAAKAGFVDIETVAKAGVNVMNSSGLKDIKEVYDVLFATLQKGAANMGEIAAYLPKIVPTAKNAGVNLNETAGAFAYMTAQGQDAAAAATLLNGAFNSLSNPKLLTNFKAMGVEIYDAQGKMLPMADIIDSLADKLDGLSDQQKAVKLASLGLDQTSAQAFAVMTQNAEKFRQTLDSTAQSSGALDEAYTNSMTAADHWGVALNNIKTLAVKIGQFFLPLITKVGEWAAGITGSIIPAIKGVKDFIADWSPVILGVAAAFLVLNANTIAATASMAAHSIWAGILTVKQWLLNAAMSANPIGIIIVGIGALIGWIVKLCRKYEGWASVWTFVKTLLVNSFKQFVANWKDDFQALWYYIQLFWLNLKSFGQYVAQLFSNIGQAIKLALSGDFSEAKAILTSEIHTDAEAEIERLKAERAQQKARYETETDQRVKEIADSWNNMKLHKKISADDIADGAVIMAPSGTPVADKAEDAVGGGGSDGGNSPGSGGGSGTGGADAVAGSAKQIKNITVNIDAFNKGGINAGNTQGLNGKSAVDIEEWFTQMLLRTIRNLETSY